MKHLYVFLKIWVESNKIVTLILFVLINGFAMHVWTSFIRPTIPDKWLIDFGDMIIILPFFLFMGLSGILCIFYRIAPIFIVPIRGIPAIIIGLLLTVVGFGVVIKGTIIFIPSIALGLINWLQGNGLP